MENRSTQGWITTHVCVVSQSLQSLHVSVILRRMGGMYIYKTFPISIHWQNNHMWMLPYALWFHIMPSYALSLIQIVSVSFKPSRLECSTSTQNSRWPRDNNGCCEITFYCLHHLTQCICGVSSTLVVSVRVGWFQCTVVLMAMRERKPTHLTQVRSAAVNTSHKTVSCVRRSRKVLRTFFVWMTEQITVELTTGTLRECLATASCSVWTFLNVPSGTVPVKSLDTHSHSRVFLNFLLFSTL